MDKIDLDTLKEQAKVYQALSHPTRLIIIHLIANGEVCVSDLAKAVEVDISTMSRHLKLLKQTGIIEGIKVNNQMFFKLKFKCVLKFFNCIEENMTKN